jgi:coproporphyrinogen III oxidase-like Fe-S oxidoreductase
VDYTFDFQTYFMIEYYRNTLGKTNYKQYELNDWMRQFTAEQKTISRDQLYTFIQHPVTDFIDLGASSIFSISDKSLAVVPTLNYSFSENMDIMAYLNFNFGREGTVYSKISGNGGLLRARVYF